MDPDTVVNSEGCRSGLADPGCGPFRVDRFKDGFVRGAVHINGGFRGRAKVRVAKFRGLPGRTFRLHLKETAAQP